MTKGPGFSLCAVTALLVSPVSWSHHWVLAVPALLLLGRQRLAQQVRLGDRGGTGAAVLAAIGWSRIIWQVPIGQGRHAELHLDPVQLSYADAYVLAGLAVLAVAAVGCGRGGAIRPARRGRPKPAGEPTGTKERPHGRGDTDSDVVAAAHDFDAAAPSAPSHDRGGFMCTRVLTLCLWVADRLRRGAVTLDGHRKIIFVLIK